MAAIGEHCILELYGCPYALLNDEAFIERTLGEASRQGMSTLLKQVTQKFKPQGVTSLVLLAESHMSIHTWPEYGYAAVDAFTCGEGADPQRACLFISQKLRAGRHVLRTIARGEQALQAPAPVFVAASRFPARRPEQPFAC